MTKAKRQMTEDLKLIDLVIELTDARIPFSSRNPDIDEMAKEKSRLILLNKADMADEKATSEWKTWFEEQGFLVCPVNSLNRADLKKINPFVRKACAEKIERDKRRGIRSRPVRAIVTGIPNVGKSTFINSFSGKASAKTGNKPGVTKGKQWIRISDSLELLDTPGILWPKFEDQNVGIKLAAIGSIRDEIMNTEELSLELIKLLNDRYPGSLEAFYGIRIGEDEKPLDVLLKIAAARGCLSKGGSYDTLRASGLLLENFRNGKIGRFTLESPAG